MSAVHEDFYMCMCECVFGGGGEEEEGKGMSHSFFLIKAWI